jgi:hypothetical protein
MYASMRSLAIVLSIVQSTLNAEKLAACTFQLAQLQVALQVYCCTVERSDELANACLPAWKASDIQ